MRPAAAMSYQTKERVRALSVDARRSPPRPATTVDAAAERQADGGLPQRGPGRETGAVGVATRCPNRPGFWSGPDCPSDQTSRDGRRGFCPGVDGVPYVPDRNGLLSPGVLRFAPGPCNTMARGRYSLRPPPLSRSRSDGTASCYRTSYFVTLVLSTRLTYAAVRNFLKRICVEAGVRVNWHDGRRFAATSLVDDGATDLDIQAIGGWQSLSMLLRYSHSARQRRSLKVHRDMAPLRGVVTPEMVGAR